MSRGYRQENGSVLAVMVLTVFVIVVPLFMVLIQMTGYLVDKQRAQTVVEAAGLLAANDLSRIIVNDSNFGYVSLSNYPAIGKATCAADGEPLPVTGINTLIGTIRLNTIIARELGNQTMCALVDADRNALDLTIQQLNGILSDALIDGNQGNWSDIHGESVDAIGDVRAFLNTNLPRNMKVQSVKLSNGWVSSGGTTAIGIPQPQRLACVNQSTSEGGNYKAFVDIPVDHCSFTFAGVGQTSSLVNAGEFKEADQDHVCSIVKIECTLTREDAAPLPFGIKPDEKFQLVACCQPFSQPDAATKGAMTVRLSGGAVPGLQSWNDFLTSSNFHDNQVTTYGVEGGDYPVDRDARMTPLPHALRSTTSQQFAEHLYYWLRNGHLRPRIDSVLAMMGDSFRSVPNQVYAYEFGEDGNIIRKDISHNPLPIAVTADSQFSAVADTRTASGVQPVIFFRNNVKHLGTQYGGKHGGQPLAGYPLKWSEVQECAGQEQLATRLGSRSKFQHGLALDIEIGGTRNVNAGMSVPSMIKLKQARRI